MISIIVPVFNVEKYLNQCVQSILCQTYGNYELILVDDGSTDNSGRMCEQYKELDKRVQVIHKENGGLSDARNKGTEAAHGEYITYIDSDDYVSEDYLETLYKLIYTYHADIAVTGIERFYDGELPSGGDSSYIEASFAGIKALENVLYQRGMDTSACAMLIKKEIAESYPFPYRKYHEDDFTTYNYYLAADLVVLSSRNQYFYRQRKGSIMHSLGQASRDELEAADNLVNVLSSVSKELRMAATAKKFSDYCQVLLSTKDLRRQDPETYRKISRFLNKSKWKMITDKKARMKNRLAAFIMVFGVKPLIIINKIRG